jgi:hypothetical protein
MLISQLSIQHDVKKIGSPGETIVIKTIQNLNVLDDRTKLHDFSICHLVSWVSSQVFGGSIPMVVD